MKRHSSLLTLWIALLLALPLAAGCGFSDKGSDEPQDGDTSETENDSDSNEALIDGDTSETENDVELSQTPITVKAPGNWNPSGERTPTGIHLTYQHDPATTLTLQWETTDINTEAYKPKVWLVPANLVKDGDLAKFEQEVTLPYVPALVFEGVAERYCTKYICSGDSLDGVLWVVEATSLTPDTDYYYRVGTFASFDERTGEFGAPDLSPVYHFRSGLPKGGATPFIVGFGSDSQSWFDTITDDDKIIRDTYGKKARFWLFGGDLTEMGTQKEMTGWFDVMQPLIHYYPFMPVQGNHDMMEGVIFGRWALPKMGEALAPGDQERAWSFTFGNAHFVGLNSMGDSTAERQVAWLESDLKAARADRDITWIVAVFHHPAYSSSSVHGSTDYVQRLFVPLFDKYHVDLCLSGHDHDYERSKPLKGGEIQEAGKGTIYIVSGGFYSKKSYGNGTSDFTAVSFDGESKSHVILSFDGGKLTGQAYKGNHEALDDFLLGKSSATSMVDSFTLSK